MTNSPPSRNSDGFAEWLRSHPFEPRAPGARIYTLADLMAAWQEARSAPSETREMLTREDLAKIVERKARALTEEYCHGDAGPGGYVWSNKEAEWQVILLEELAEEIRNAKGI